MSTIRFRALYSTTGGYGRDGCGASAPDTYFLSPIFRLKRLRIFLAHDVPALYCFTDWVDVILDVTDDIDDENRRVDQQIRELISKVRLKYDDVIIVKVVRASSDFWLAVIDGIIKEEYPRLWPTVECDFKHTILARAGTDHQKGTRMSEKYLNNLKTPIYPNFPLNSRDTAYELDFLTQGLQRERSGGSKRRDKSVQLYDNVLIRRNGAYMTSLT
ncbi:hypothetical protein K449DRAFT_439759 [Hypoxylon sp. EC38]|nr:hypothetical protein K449DRAFT_439759 [Hypoxylon sp. EC38]